MKSEQEIKSYIKDIKSKLNMSTYISGRKTNSKYKVDATLGMLDFDHEFRVTGYITIDNNGIHLCYSDDGIFATVIAETRFQDNPSPVPRGYEDLSKKDQKLSESLHTAYDDLLLMMVRYFQDFRKANFRYPNRKEIESLTK